MGSKIANLPSRVYFYPSAQMIFQPDNSMIFVSSYGISEANVDENPEAILALLKALDEYDLPQAASLNADKLTEEKIYEIISLLLKLGVVHTLPPNPALPSSQHPLLLRPIDEAAKLWSDTLYNETVLVGGGKSAAELYLALNQGQGKISFLSCPLNSEAPQNRNQLWFQPGNSSTFEQKKTLAETYYLDSREIKRLFSGKRFAICAFEKLTFAQAKELYQIASDSDVFLLFVSSCDGGEIRLGPMLAPQIPDSFEESFLEDYDLNDESLTHFSKIFSQRAFNESTFKHSVEALMQVIATPTLPLLWMNLIISEDRILPLMMKNWRLSFASSASAQLSIEKILDPETFSPNRLIELEKNLKKGFLVSIKDAFLPSVAKLAYDSLNRATRWDLNEDFFSDGFYYHHHNIVERSEYPPELLSMILIFNSLPTKKWMQDLSGKSCKGSVVLSGSYYMAGDHSFPHNDHGGNRTVAYVWHLAQNWQPTWGGGLFWSASNEFLFPSFNTLYLFVVSEYSYHFVMQVLPSAQGKRLAINGWWVSEKPIEYASPKSLEKSLEKSKQVIFHASYLKFGK